MSTVVVVRAGSTDYDAQHRVLGTLDMPVNERGIEQIREVGQQLASKGMKVGAILTSPDDPARSTAHALAESLPGVRVKETEDLRNVNQGLWQGLTESDIRKRFPRLFRSGREDVTAICPPEGETLSDACQRVERVLCKSMKKHEVLVVVAPEPLATVIRCTLQHRRPHISACLCGEESQEMVQVIQSATFEAAHFVSAEDSHSAGLLHAASGDQESNR